MKVPGMSTTLKTQRHACFLFEHWNIITTLYDVGVAGRPRLGVVKNGEVNDHAVRCGSRDWLRGFDRQVR